MKKKVWNNKKHGKGFVGKYKYLNPNERVFTLFNGKRMFTFESWQMAKLLNWKAE
jgi:hypothetical protein